MLLNNSSRLISRLKVVFINSPGTNAASLFNTKSMEIAGRLAVDSPPEIIVSVRGKRSCSSLSVLYLRVSWNYLPAKNGHLIGAG